MRRKRLDAKSSQALSEALSKVRQALKKNQDIFLTHDLSLFSTEAEKAKEMAKAVGAGVWSKESAWAALILSAL